jgi:DNA-binding transcriptional LysR family regulator
MDLRQLEILCAIAETGTFTGAGEKLHVSQPAISRQVLLLEEELGEPLFLRQGRVAAPTRAGQKLIQLGHRLLEDLTSTVNQIRDEHHDLAGTLRIAGGMTVCLYVLPPLLKEFRRVHPRVEVKLITGATPRLVRQLRTAGADVGLLTLPIDDPSCVVVPAMREELLLVMPPRHALARRRRVRPSDLANEPFVLFERGSNTRRTVDRLFSRVGVEPKVVLETENVEILKALVAIGMGLTIIPYQAVAAEVDGGQLACARVTGAMLERETGWVYPRSSHLPRAVGELITMFETVRPSLRLTRDERARYASTPRAIRRPSAMAGAVRG